MSLQCQASESSTHLLAQNDQNNQQNDPAGHRDIQPGHACNPRYRLKSGCKIQLVLAAATCAAAGFRPTLPQLTSHRSSQPLDPWERRRCTKPCSYRDRHLSPRPRAERKSKSAKNSHQFPVIQEKNLTVASDCRPSRSAFRLGGGARAPADRGLTPSPRRNR